MPFIPHTESEIKAMLAAIGVSSLEALFAEIPPALKKYNLEKSNIPPQVTEMELSRELQEYAAYNQTGLNFIGAGAYEHYIPAVVSDLISRGEFMTAYTPYQAEASQGTLQLIYEYQTMIASLTGMEVANASLYDGASALAEAVLMAVRANKKPKARRVLLAGSLHPNYRHVVETIVKPQQIELITLPYCPQQGHITSEIIANYPAEDFTAVVIPQPNFFGVLEEVDGLIDWAHQQGALAIAVVNPLALALLKEPGCWGQQGADIVCGEGQPLGVPLASGGPYFGFLCSKMAYVRQMPGRIVGRTQDQAGNSGFTLTLQAREQHIRRSKATSNICTNQGLLVTAATIYMSLLGPEGLRRVALAAHANTRSLLAKLTSIPGVEAVFNRPYFHEVVIRLAQQVDQVLAQLAARGVYGGYNLTHSFPELGQAMLVCATETKTPADLVRYHYELQQVLKNNSAP